MRGENVIINNGDSRVDTTGAVTEYLQLSTALITVNTNS